MSDINSDDLYNLDKQRAVPYFDYGASEVSTRSPLRKPQRDEWFRVRPGDEHTADLTLLELNKDESRDLYLLAPDLIIEFTSDPDLNSNLKRVRVFTVINRTGTVFLWPAMLPTGDKNSGRTWRESALEVADVATRFWVKMLGDRAVGAYKYWKASGNLPDPEWKGPDLQGLIRIAFKDNAISTTEHEVIRYLRGEK